MTNPMFNPQPNYSGVTIQISNPAVNVGGNDRQCYANLYPQAAISTGYINSNNIQSGYGNMQNIPVYYNNLHQNRNYNKNPHGSYLPISNNTDYNGTKYNQTNIMNSEYNHVNSKLSRVTDENAYMTTLSGEHKYLENTGLNSIENPQTQANYQLGNQAKNDYSTYPAQYYLNNYNNGVPANNEQPQGIEKQYNENAINRQNGDEADFELNQNNKSTRIKDNYSNTNDYNEKYGNHKNYSEVYDKNNTNRNIAKESSYYDNNVVNNKQYENYAGENNYNQQTQNKELQNQQETVENGSNANMNSYKIYADKNEPKDTDMTRSQYIKDDLAAREAELQEEKKNSKETKIVALTDEYIKSLENYLNNPNDEIRLMASKEILTRLDEDKDRYNDAALNALLNKMLQDPNKLVRIASLSAFASQLASGNDYTVKLLHNIQSNPNADKEDVLQAADILLKMSAGVEIKNIPNKPVKNNNDNNK